MKTICHFVKQSLLLLSLVLVAARVPAQGDAPALPEGEGLGIIAVSCTQCHALDRLMKVELTAAEWENALYDMMARGAIVERKDLATVRDYLVRAFATDRRED
ncbi:MAG: hypothetical protein R3176_01350 [Woeseiaceae bacterium]|nr:hypothetical protein [Woeseiaceae bacterium]